MYTLLFSRITLIRYFLSIGLLNAVNLRLAIGDVTAKAMHHGIRGKNISHMRKFVITIKTYKEQKVASFGYVGHILRVEKKTITLFTSRCKSIPL